MSSFTGETKLSSTSENITTSTFYTNKLPPSTNLPNDLFDKSADLTKKGIESSPAILRIFIEPLSNAIDNAARSKKSKTPCTTIKVNIDKKSSSLKSLTDE